MNNTGVHADRYVGVHRVTLVRSMLPVWMKAAVHVRAAQVTATSARTAGEFRISGEVVFVGLYRSLKASRFSSPRPSSVSQAPMIRDLGRVTRGYTYLLATSEEEQDGSRTTIYLQE